VIIDMREQTEKLPDFLIVGAAKSGTTSLYDWLRQHPHIFMPAVKEPNYFSAIANANHINEWREYVCLFSAAKDGQRIGEASVSYLFFHERAIPLIKEKLGSPKIIIILRNPVERAFSHYLYYCKLGREKAPFYLTIDQNYTVNDPWKIRNPYLDMGFYYKQVKDYKDNFLDVRTYLYEDLKYRGGEMLRDLFTFLGVDPDFEPVRTIRNQSGIPRNSLLRAILSNDWLNGAIIPRIPYWFKSIARELLLEKPSLGSEERRKLIGVYKEDIERLSVLIDRDISHWMNE